MRPRVYTRRTVSPNCDEQDLPQSTQRDGRGRPDANYVESSAASRLRELMESRCMRARTIQLLV